MGAINYFTSDYITLGVRPYDADDFIKDQEFIDFIRDEWGVDISDQNAVYDAVRDEISSCYENEYENIKTELEKHYFYYYHITIKPGYYEGFTLDIENNFPVALDSWEDRREAMKEITEIKQFLIDCAGLGMVACFPGWCTGYRDYKGTLEAIREAVKEMRSELNTVPTWTQYNRGCKYGY